jgi:hypothetical protein
MEQQVKNYLVTQTNHLLKASSACPEAKAAAKAFLKALGTPKEKEVTLAYFQELAEDVTSIDDLYAFAYSPYAEKEFGKEGVKAFRAHVDEIKAKGVKYCDCPACAAAQAILAKRDQF